MTEPRVIGRTGSTNIVHCPGHCRICGYETNYSFTSVSLQKYKFDANNCDNCGFLQIKNPHWLNEAYEEAIAVYDTGLVERNISLAARLRTLLFYIFGNTGRFVDFSGGTGLFVRLMRDYGYDFYWRDPYCKNIHARGFEFELGGKYNAITLFETLEHIIDPIFFMNSALEDTDADVIFFTTELFSDPPPKPGEWWYYAFDAGQHISFYQEKTLNIISNQLSMKYTSYGAIHVFCKDHVYTRLKQYQGSSMIRRFARYRSARVLQSKTMSDHLFLLKQGRLPE